jgi:pSer/pThr/pTyr-binding forkhead associated (FHA) protein
MASLIVIQGSEPGKRFELGSRTLSIGREPARDVQLVDPKVSRKHALIRREGEVYLISSAKALNGVLVNGKAIDAETKLREGDEIVMGDTLLCFTESSDPNVTNAVFERKVVNRDVRDKRTIM